MEADIPGVETEREEIIPGPHIMEYKLSDTQREVAAAGNKNMTTGIIRMTRQVYIVPVVDINKESDG